ncbi:hypothetical protein [Methanolapillus ohkumae]|uniref:Uncharacterized protein n=1 Tax=Methanolapillus ohkumae TaxID=3028298 RepID=A0AA96V6S8_9EURY|nr:hypothetical protein MsAm2_15050 [Methanosarcinaceae archaeon Am2]
MNQKQKKVILLVLLIPSIIFFIWKFQEPHGFFMFKSLGLGAFCIYTSLNPHSYRLPKIWFFLFFVFGVCFYGSVAWLFLFPNQFDPKIVAFILTAFVVYVVVWYLGLKKSEKL